MIFGKKRHKLSDAELIALYKKTSRKKWMGELFNRHAHLVFGVCMKYLKNEMEANDATLTIFEKLITDLREKQVDTFSHWLYVVSRNHCLMNLRQQQRFVMNDVDLNENQVNTDDMDLEHKMLSEAKISSLEAAIKRLSSQQSECIKLFYIEQKCYADIAEITGFSIKGVKSHIQNGKRNLKFELSRKDEFKAQQ